jgi:hypothetical protein
MARDLVRCLEQHRLPPREVREAIRGFAADIEHGNDYIRTKWNDLSTPINPVPGWDLTFGTQDEGLRGQFEEPGDSKSSLRYGGKTRPTVPHTDPGITEPVARNSLGKSRERDTSIPPHTQGSSHIKGVKYYPKTHNPTGVGRGKCRTCCWNCGGRGHLAADCRQSPLYCRFCGQSGHTMSNCYYWNTMCKEHRARSMAPILGTAQNRGNPTLGNDLGLKAPTKFLRAAIALLSLE